MKKLQKLERLKEKKKRAVKRDYTERKALKNEDFRM